MNESSFLDPPTTTTTQIRAPARATSPMTSQPGQSRCPHFLAGPRENSLPAGACPILLPSPLFLPLPTSFLPALGYSLCRKGPRFQGKAPRSSSPGQDTCFLHHLGPSALPGGRKSDPGLGTWEHCTGDSPRSFCPSLCLQP